MHHVHLNVSKQTKLNFIFIYLLLLFVLFCYCMYDRDRMIDRQNLFLTVSHTHTFIPSNTVHTCLQVTEEIQERTSSSHCRDQDLSVNSTYSQLLNKPFASVCPADTEAQHNKQAVLSSDKRRRRGKIPGSVFHLSCAENKKQ